VLLAHPEEKGMSRNPGFDLRVIGATCAHDPTPFPARREVSTGQLA